MALTTRQKLLAMAMAGCFANAAGAATFSNTYFFGDSLTDSGAYTGAAGVAAGAHFTTNPSPNYADIMAAHFGTSAKPYNPANPNLPAGAPTTPRVARNRLTPTPPPRWAGLPTCPPRSARPSRPGG